MVGGQGACLDCARCFGVAVRIVGRELTVASQHVGGITATKHRSVAHVLEVVANLEKDFSQNRFAESLATVDQLGC